MNDEVQTAQAAQTATNAVSEVAKTQLSTGAKWGIAAALATAAIGIATGVIVFTKKHKAKKETEVKAA